MGGLVGKSGLLGEWVGSTHEKRKIGCVRAQKGRDWGLGRFAVADEDVFGGLGRVFGAGGVVGLDK